MAKKGKNIANRQVYSEEYVVMFEMLKYYGFRCSYFILPFMQHPVDGFRTSKNVRIRGCGIGCGTWYTCLGAHDTCVND